MWCNLCKWIQHGLKKIWSIPIGVKTHVICLRPLAFLAEFEKKNIFHLSFVYKSAILGEDGKIAHFQVKYEFSNIFEKGLKMGVKTHVICLRPSTFLFGFEKFSFFVYLLK